MEHDERYSMAILFIIALISVGAITFMFINAKSSQPHQVINPYFLTGGVVRHFCQDTDGGIVPYQRGITRTETQQLIDKCIGENGENVLEYYCSPTDTIKAVSIPCPYACVEGVCMQHALTTYTFDPFDKHKMKELTGTR